MMLEEDILIIPDASTLAHYLLFRIRSSNLPKKPVSAFVEQLTPEGHDRMMKFIALAVDMWNQCHSEKLELGYVIELYNKMTDRDIKDIEKLGLVPP